MAKANKMRNNDSNCQCILKHQISQLPARALLCIYAHTSISSSCDTYTSGNGIIRTLLFSLYAIKSSSILAGRWKRCLHGSLTPMIHIYFYKLRLLSSLLIKCFCFFLDSYQRQQEEEMVSKIISRQQIFLSSFLYHLYFEEKF